MPYGTLAADTLQSSTGNTAPVFRDGNGLEIGRTCRAWSMSNSSNALVSSFFISSITNNGTGDFTLTFSAAFPTSYYAPVTSSGAAVSNQGTWNKIYDIGATTVRIQHWENNSQVNTNYVYCAIFF